MATKGRTEKNCLLFKCFCLEKTLLPSWPNMGWVRGPLQRFVAATVQSSRFAVYLSHAKCINTKTEIATTPTSPTVQESKTHRRTKVVWRRSCVETKSRNNCEAYSKEKRLHITQSESLRPSHCSVLSNKKRCCNAVGWGLAGFDHESWDPQDVPFISKLLML